jgi:IMP dehydrogenase
VDVLVIDTAHGHSQGVLDMVRRVRQRFSDVELVAGNVATAEGTRALIDQGVDAVKVGIGAGSICTPRVVAGIGVPDDHGDHGLLPRRRGARRAGHCRRRHPVLGDITKALAVGASTTMIGNLFAGHRRKPGRADSLPGAGRSRSTAAWDRLARCAAAAATATSRTNSTSMR